MTTHPRTFKVAVAALALGSTLTLTACDFGSLGSGSAGSSGGSTSTAPPTTTVPPTTTPGGGGSGSITEVTTPAWKDRNGPIDIASFRIVPGDVLTYSGSYRITLTGTYTKALLTVDDIVFTSGGQLTGRLQPQVTAQIDGTPVPAVLDRSYDGKTVDVTASFTFDPQTSGKVAQSDSANFDDITVRLEQSLP
ncbi:alternate-type signal peptide domain-containing protein [Prescottella sp. R16]|uniref:alternate-type signal peptide domain-containing protein n=1 Tax=Prescottella sp. R16 TaxID=3064529 RepID=UPI00272E54DB|nr:alternate-type signal peptide domain-containing protein [Prescottella sp. R16]